MQIFVDGRSVEKEKTVEIFLTLHDLTLLADAVKRSGRAAIDRRCKVTYLQLTPRQSGATRLQFGVCELNAEPTKEMA